MSTILAHRAGRNPAARYLSTGKGGVAVHPFLCAPGFPPALLGCESFRDAYRLAGDPNLLAAALQSPSGPDIQRWSYRQPYPERALRLAVAAAAGVQAGVMSIDAAHARLGALPAPKHRTVSLETLRDLPAAVPCARYLADDHPGIDEFAAQLFADALGAFASTTGYTPTGSSVGALTARWRVVWPALASPDTTQKGVVTVGVSQLDAGRAARRARQHLPGIPGLSRSRTVAADRLLLGSTGGAPSWLAACARHRDTFVLSRWTATWAAHLLRCDAAHDQLPPAARANAERQVRRASWPANQGPRWTAPGRWRSRSTGTAFAPTRAGQPCCG